MLNAKQKKNIFHYVSDNPL